MCNYADDFGVRSVFAIACQMLAKRLLIGATVGAGFRFIDEFNIKVTPEIRYTRWNGTTFNQDSTRSPRNQLEVGIGFSR